MPYRAPRPCRKVGCVELVTDRDGFCEQHRSEANAKYNRDRRPEFHKLYATPRWTRMSRRFIEEHPFCAKCNGFAELTHHVVPHNGDPALFFDWNNLEALCKACHNREHRRGAAA